MGLLEDTGGQDGIKEGIILSLLLRSDIFSDLAIFDVIVVQGHECLHSRSIESIGRYAREQSIKT